MGLALPFLEEVRPSDNGQFRTVSIMDQSQICRVFQSTRVITNETVNSRVSRGDVDEDIHQRSRRARLAIDFSTGCACVSHAFDVLGVCVMVTLALLRIETERWRGITPSLVQRGLIGGFLGRLGCGVEPDIPSSRDFHSNADRG
jgi:hypothetical protein